MLASSSSSHDGGFVDDRLMGGGVLFCDGGWIYVYKDGGRENDWMRKK